MKVAVDEQQQPGVFIALEEWPQIKDHIADLYQFMKNLSRKSIFEMTPAELQIRLHPVTEKLVSNALENGAHVAYKNSDPSIAAKYVNEYADQTLEYININQSNGKRQVVKRTR